MTTTIRAVAMSAVVFAGSVGFQPWEPSHRSCGDATLVGGYAVSLSGVNFGLGGIQYLLVGQFASDGHGHFVGKATQSVQGQVARVNFTGDYTVDEDCSGAATLTFESGITAHLDLFLANGGDEVHFIDSSQGTLESGTATSVRSHDRR
jgi:hypothetical protein